MPEVTSALAKAVRENDMENIQKYQREIDQWMDIYSIGTPFIPVVKRALQLRGLPISDTSTVPFLPVTKEQEDRIKALMTKMGLL